MSHGTFMWNESEKIKYLEVENPKPLSPPVE